MATKKSPVGQFVPKRSFELDVRWKKNGGKVHRLIEYNIDIRKKFEKVKTSFHEGEGL